ncbi:MAG: hypothetical protein L0H70_06665, partial [Xanthomonadales bacterium]|nr:hypothetical protein [Xanthomonadales bacterium]
MPENTDNAKAAFRIAPKGTTAIIVHGDPATTRAKLVAAGFRKSGTKQDGGLRFDAKDRAKIEAALTPEPTTTKNPQNTPPSVADGNNERAARVKASKDAGHVHLDALEPDVEGMRGKVIYSVHDPKVHGVVRTVDNNSNVWVNWSDEYSAKKELAHEAQEGKKTVFRSSLGASDLKDYVVREKSTQNSTPGAEPFGPIYTGLTNQPEAAIKKLMAEKDGEVADAFTHPELGPIAFVYGNEKMGLRHIEAIRGINWVNLIPTILRNGRVERDKKLPRALIVQDADPANVAVIRLDWNGQQKTWLVTAHPDDTGKWSGADKTSRTADDVQGSVQGNPSRSNPHSDSTTTGTIEDFGEKLGGARKDQAPSLSVDLTDNELTSKPLSAIWT